MTVNNRFFSDIDALEKPFFKLISVVSEMKIDRRLT